MNKKEEDIIKEIVELNDDLFVEERELKLYEEDVLALRYKLAGEKSEKRIVNLKAAVMNLNAARERVSKKRTEFEQKLMDYYKEIYS